MKRTIEQWQNCDPNAMAHNQSDAAKAFAFEDAKADILELYAENKRIRRVMQIIAYPRRGTHEEGYGIMDMAKLIQSAFTAEYLDS
jgi:hypothetical protein